MKTSFADTAANECTQVSDRAVDAVRQAVNVAREAHLLKTIASDAVEDGVHDLEDLRESAAHRIKKTPLVAVGLALGVGILFGIALGRIGRKPPALAR